MISAVYFINLKGEIVIYRSYRDDVRFSQPHILICSAANVVPA
jgi:hypothetical protein